MAEHEQYTPTDEDMVACWARASQRAGRDAWVAEQEARRWLAAHDARVRRDAAREALSAVVEDYLLHGDRTFHAAVVASQIAYHMDTHHPEETP